MRPAEPERRVLVDLTDTAGGDLTATLSSSSVRLLEAYTRVRAMRGDPNAGATDVAWNEGYLRGAIEAVAVIGSMSPAHIEQRLFDQWRTANTSIAQ